MKKRWNKVRRLLCLAMILSLVLPFAGPAAVLPASAVTQAEIDALKSDANDLASQKKELQAQLNEVKADKNEALKQKQLLEEQIEVIRDPGDYTKIAILGKDGKPLTGPDFSVHHKVAVKDAAEIPDLLDVNKFENLCLTIEYPYHRILHSLDSTQTIDRRESYTSRIYMDKDIIFW